MKFYAASAHVTIHLSGLDSSSHDAGLPSSGRNDMVCYSSSEILVLHLYVHEYWVLDLCICHAVSCCEFFFHLFPLKSSWFFCVS